MTPRQVKTLRAVRLVDPIRVAVRFHAPERGGIVGAGGGIVPRPLLDTVGEIAAFSPDRKRVCIHWPHGATSDNLCPSMWLDVELVEPVKAVTT